MAEYNVAALKDLVASKDVAAIKEFMNEHGLVLRGNRLVPADEKSLKDAEAYWDKSQLVRKITLNSIYGALLNEACRQFDPRIGQSVTLTGRCITKHMISKLNEEMDGEYSHYGRTVIYGDTDSAYFSLWPVRESEQWKDFEWTAENVIKLYDDLGERVNQSFPGFMDRSFNTGLERGAIIAAGREIVAQAGIFIKKKRYAALVIDTEGVRHDVDGNPGKVKAMGVETQRSDTPKYIQDFLKEILKMVLTDKSEEEVVAFIEDFRYNSFRKLPPWRLGRPTSVNGLTNYIEKADAASIGIETMLSDPDFDDDLSVNMPGHHKAAINWNRMREANGDVHSLEINDGAKVIVCDLKPNNHGIVSIARPVDQEEHALPEWFTMLPFDRELMEAKLVDDKLANLIGILDWNLAASKKDTAFAKLLGVAEQVKKKPEKGSKKAKPTAGDAFSNMFGF